MRPQYGERSGGVDHGFGEERYSVLIGNFFTNKDEALLMLVRRPKNTGFFDFFLVFFVCLLFRDF